MSDWADWMEFASQEVFESMLGVRAARIDAAACSGTSDLTAIVSLTGSPSGVLSISCQSAAAAHIAMRMLGSSAPEPDDNAMDALGEVCNMVAGSIKSRLSASEDLCRISVPTIIGGNNYCVRSMVNGEHYELCLDFEGKPVKLSLEIHHPS
ncbi:MAG: chemotaxis protein CheX [Terriglobia bacterium]